MWPGEYAFFKSFLPSYRVLKQLLILNQPPRVMPTGFRNEMTHLPNPGDYWIIFHGWRSPNISNGVTSIGTNNPSKVLMRLMWLNLFALAR